MAEPFEKTDDPVSDRTGPEPRSGWRTVRNWIFGMVVLFVVSSAVDIAVGIIFGKKADCSALTSEFAKGVCEADQKTGSANTNSSDIEKTECSAIKPDYEKGLCEGAQKAAAARKNPKDLEIDCSKRTSSVTKSLCEGNKYVVTNVKALDPFNFAGIFYSYLWNGKPPQPQAFYSFSQPVPDAIDPNGKEKKGIISLIIVFLYRRYPVQSTRL